MTTQTERTATSTWAVDVFLGRQDGRVHAEAHLHASRAPLLTGSGEATLGRGAEEPVVAEELAASRALERLAVSLLSDARDQCEPAQDKTKARAKPHAADGTGLAGDRAVGRILVGLDRPLRPTSTTAWALGYAEASGHALELCHVVEDAGPAGERTLEGSLQDAKEEMADLVTELRAHHPALDIGSSVLLGSESVLLARALVSDLVVIGRQSGGLGEDAYLGGTAMTLAQDARAPVVVVPPSWSRRAHRDAPVVVAIDALEPHAAALEFAFVCAQSDHAPLIAVAAWQPPASRRAFGTPHDDDDELMERIADGLGSAVAPLRERYPGVRAMERSPRGNPVEVILGLAEPASILVIGRPDHGRHWRTPLGAVSRRLLHRSSVPVAVVPTGWQPRRGCAARSTSGSHGRTA